MTNPVEKRKHTYCPWTGEKDCGCTQFPWLDDKMMLPARCQQNLTVASAEVHLKRIAPERAEECKRWIAAGRPPLSEWYGEPEDEPSQALVPSNG